MVSSTFVLYLMSFVMLVQSMPQYDADMDAEDDEYHAIDIPDFISKSETKFVEPGKLMALYCQLNGVIDKVPLMWVKIGQNGESDRQLALSAIVFSRDERIRVRTMDQKDGEILTINNFNEKDTGIYECRIMAEKPKGIKFDVQVEKEPEAEKPGEIKTGGSSPDGIEDVKDSNEPGSAQVNQASLFCALVAIFIGHFFA